MANKLENLEKRLGSHKKFVNISGWLGMIAVLSAYVLSNVGIITSSGWVYPALNLFGGGATIILGLGKRARPVLVLNTIWVVMAVVSLAKWLA